MPRQSLTRCGRRQLLGDRRHDYERQLAALSAPREVNEQAFNIDRSDENDQIGKIAEIIAAVVPSRRVV